MTTPSRFWDWYARCYDGLLETAPYRRLLDETAACLPASGGLLLDAGCGTGNLLRTIRDRHPGVRLRGIDFSRAMLRRASAKVPEAEFAQGDLDGPLPYPDRCFDVVTCINVLYAVADPARTVAELKRVLKPGGVLVASSPLPRPNVRSIVRAHAAEAGWLRSLPLLARLLVLVLFNLFIVRRTRSYHFMDKPEVAELLGAEDIRRTYARQNWFACATLPAPARPAEGRATGDRELGPVAAVGTAGSVPGPLQPASRL